MSEETFVTPLKAASTAKDTETAPNVEISLSWCRETDFCLMFGASFFARNSESRFALALDLRSLVTTFVLDAIVRFAHEDAWRTPFKERLVLDANTAEDIIRRIPKKGKVCLRYQEKSKGSDFSASARASLLAQGTGRDPHRSGCGLSLIHI
eukprot:746674-Hanusia_phi.AAC.1